MSRIAPPPVRCSEPALSAAAPSAEWFPAFPASWYLIGPSRLLRSRPVGCEPFGRRLVAFRAEAGRPALIDADCAHMGADLSRGRVIDGCVQCPFHGWRYDALGRCTHIPAQAEIPSAAQRTSYRVEQRHGLLFALSGSRPRFSLPQFFEPVEATFIPGRATRYLMECPWWMFAANGFDMQHFALVHDRQLLEEPLVDSPAPFSRRIRLNFRVTGSSFPDRLIRTFLGEQVRVSITVWAGNLIAVTALFRRATSRLLFATCPVGRDKTRVDLIVFAERGPRWWRWTIPLTLWVRRLMTTAFVRDDTARVVRAAYRPESLIEADREMIDYYRWLAALSSTEESDS